MPEHIDPMRIKLRSLLNPAVDPVVAQDADEECHQMPSTGSVRLVTGLGNPGRKYERTRHNIGFMVIDELGRRWNAEASRSRFQGQVAEARFDNARIVLLKPQTYMNDSGLAIRQALQWYKVPVDQSLVVYDDLDLPFGTLRIRPGGGSGGHNGLKSTIAQLGTEQIPRLRVGIGRSDKAVIAHVLSPFSPEERASLDGTIDRAVDAVETWIRYGVFDTMNLINGVK